MVKYIKTHKVLLFSICALSYIVTSVISDISSLDDMSRKALVHFGVSIGLVFAMIVTVAFNYLIESIIEHENKLVDENTRLRRSSLYDRIDNILHSGLDSSHNKKIKREYKVGECFDCTICTNDYTTYTDTVVTVDIDTYGIRELFKCESCYFYHSLFSCPICSAEKRTDGKSVVFINKEDLDEEKNS